MCIFLIAYMYIMVIGELPDSDTDIILSLSVVLEKEGLQGYVRIEIYQKLSIMSFYVS